MPYVVGNSVLDLGCGLGGMSDRVAPRLYLGVDFCPEAIRYARQNTANEHARFIVGDIRKVDFAGADTVLLLEVLEHVDNPVEVVAVALFNARQRIIATVPRDMPGKAHVHPQWDKKTLQSTFGDMAVYQLFGGPTSDRWWLVVKDIAP